MPAKQTQAKINLLPKVRGKTIQKKAKNVKKVLTVGEHFSCRQYLKVLSITGKIVKLQTENGKEIEVEKVIMEEDFYSGDHYDREVDCSMTELSQILQSAKDDIFKVQFKKKVDENTILSKLETFSSLNSKNLSKEIIDGELCTLVAHLIKTESNSGRSLVIEVESKGFR